MHTNAREVVCNISAAAVLETGEDGYIEIVAETTATTMAKLKGTVSSMSRLKVPQADWANTGIGSLEFASKAQTTALCKALCLNVSAATNLTMVTSEDVFKSISTGGHFPLLANIDREMKSKFLSEAEHQKWRRAMSRALELQQYEEKDMVYFAGSEASAVLWLYSGSVSLFETDPLTGSTKLTAMKHKSECFGFAPPFKLASKRKYKGKHTCIGARKLATDARAEEGVTILRLSRERIDELIQNYPLFDEVWTSQLQEATQAAEKAKLSQDELRKGSDTIASQKRASKDKGNAVKGNAAKGNAAKGTAARSASKPLARFGSAAEPHLWGGEVHSSSRAATIERKHAPDMHLAKNIQKQVEMVWQIGDRVEVIKKASLLGHTGVVVDGDWQGRVQVKMDPVVRPGCRTAARKRQSLLGDGIATPPEEATIRSFLSNELIAFNNWDERQFEHKHKSTRGDSRRLTKFRYQAKMRKWQASDVVRVVKEGSQLGQRAQVLDGDWKDSGRVRVRMDHDGRVRSYFANEVELVAWATSQKLWQLLEIKAAIVLKENKAFAEKHTQSSTAVGPAQSPTDTNPAVPTDAFVRHRRSSTGMTWAAGDRVQIAKAGTNKGAKAVVVGWMCMGSSNTSATGGSHPKDRVLVKMEVSLNTKSYLPHELISSNSKEQAIDRASEMMFQAAADAADAAQWAENDIKGAVAFRKLHNEAQGRPEKLKVEDLQELLLHYLHFDVTAVTKATLLSQLVPFRAALRISSIIPLSAGGAARKNPGPWAEL
jgi:hypothetical protein